MTPSLSKRAKRSLSWPRPWDRSLTLKHGLSTPSGWLRDDDGKTWKIPHGCWQYSETYHHWFPVLICRAPAAENGCCTRGQCCRRVHVNKTARRHSSCDTPTTETASITTDLLTSDSTAENSATHDQTVNENSEPVLLSIETTSEDQAAPSITEQTPEEQTHATDDNTDVSPELDTTDTSAQEEKPAETDDHVAPEPEPSLRDTIKAIHAIPSFKLLAKHVRTLERGGRIISSQGLLLHLKCRRADIILLGDSGLEYAAALQHYYQCLHRIGFLRKGSELHTFPDSDDEELNYLEDLINEDEGHGGMVVVNQKTKLDAYGTRRLQKLAERRPDLVIVIVANRRRLYSQLQVIHETIETVVRLPKDGKAAMKSTIRQSLLEELRKRSKGPAAIEGGEDGSLIANLVQQIYKATKTNNESVQKGLTRTLGEVYSRQYTRLLSDKHAELGSDAPLLTAADVRGPNNEEATDSTDLDGSAQESESSHGAVMSPDPDRFKPVLEYSQTMLPSLVKLIYCGGGEWLPGRHHLNLLIKAAGQLDCSEAGSHYFERLREFRAIPEDSKYNSWSASCRPGALCLSDTTDNDDDEDTEYDDEADTDNDESVISDSDIKCNDNSTLESIRSMINATRTGVLLVNIPNQICKRCEGAILALQRQQDAERLVLILAVRDDAVLKTIKSDVLEWFPSQVALADPRLDETLESKIQKALRQGFQKKYDHRMQVERGWDGLVMQACARRIAEGLGENEKTADFEAAVTKVVEDVHGRYLARHLEASDGELTDDKDYFLLSRTDLLGPEPLLDSYRGADWDDLQQMVGLNKVKSTVRSLFDGLLLNYHREIEGKAKLHFSLSRIFLGPPGTGKTTVAKIYGKLLAKLGYLSSSELVVKNASDFIAQYVGHSVELTKKNLEEARGKVLLIDEAYMLNPQQGDYNCPFRIEVIDTLVGEVQNTVGEDRCIIMCGYKKEMEDFITNSNPGFKRRFPLEEAFVFENFTNQELDQILERKMQAQSVTTTEEGRAVASKVLDLWKQRPNFGNGGEIDNLLSRAVCNFQGRFSAASEATRLQMAAESVLMPEDFDPEYARGTTSSEPEFNLLGLERSLAVFRGLVKQARIMKRHKKDPKTVMPFNLVFKGPPGTGKTSFARQLGQIYYDMGILSSKDVVEASGNDLMGGYVGQTSMQTTKLVERSLGKVLLIDEAYQLGGTGSVARYAKEARDTLVYLLTNPGYQRKLVVVLVGYESEMDSLLKENPGLSGRFPQHVYFESLPSRQCLLLLKRNIEKLGLATSFEPDDVEIIECFDRLRLLGSWANGRDVETLAGQIVRSAFERLPDGDDCDLVLPTVDQSLVLPALLQWLDNFGTGGCS